VLERRIAEEIVDICSDSSYDLSTFESDAGGSPCPGQEIAFREKESRFGNSSNVYVIKGTLS
jgi:hypothetical protein